MFLAPNSGNHRARVLVERDGRHRVSSSSFDGCHVEPKRVATIMRTTDVKIGVALQARHACAVVSFAKLAGLIVPKCACTNSFYHIKTGSITELDFRMPECTVDVDPIVICGTLERLTW